MWRSILLLYPFLTIYVLVSVLVFVPVTWLIRSIRPIYWIARQGCRIGLRLAGVRVRVENLEYAYQHPVALFVANHVSNVEPVALFSVLPRIAAIIKKELTKVPFLGFAMNLGGFIGVERRAPNSRKQALEQAAQTMRKGISLLVFPEGTRNQAKELLPFRPGPFQISIETGIPIVPITVHGATSLMPKGKSFVQPGEIKLVFHQPVETAGLDDKNRLELMQRVRQTMQDSLDARAPGQGAMEDNTDA